MMHPRKATGGLNAGDCRWRAHGPAASRLPAQKVQISKVTSELTSESLAAAGGALMGLAFGIATYYVLRWMRVCGAGHDQQASTMV